jgi:hypothetical protein
MGAMADNLLRDALLGRGDTQSLSMAVTVMMPPE